MDIVRRVNPADDTQRKRALSRLATTAVAASVAFSLVGCHADKSDGGVVDTVVTQEQEKNVATVSVEPLEAIDDSTREVVAGVGIDVPDGFEYYTATDGEETIVSVLDSDGLGVAMRIRQDPTTDEDLEIARTVVVASLATMGDRATDVELVGVQWPEAGYATGVRATANLEGSDPYPTLAVLFRDDAGATFVAATVRSQTPTLQNSVAFQMLQSIRFEN